MIRLTTDDGPVWVNPDHITTIAKQTAGPDTHLRFVGRGDWLNVKEAPEIVVEAIEASQALPSATERHAIAYYQAPGPK